MTEQVIVCVDDERIVLDSLKRELKEHFGDLYLYEMAENADDALDLIEELHEEGMNILVIVSDWLMPGVKGDELLIRVHEKYPRIVKVMLTGQADDEAIERARMKANLHHCIHKPWSKEELTGTILSGVQKL